jgi:uncharacterized protein YndB with AHSA1/START domain
MENLIKIEKFVNHPVSKVWKAITEEESVSKWFLPGKFKAEERFNYELKGTPRDNWDGRIYGTVLEVNEPNRLVYTFKTNELDTEMTVTWKLTEKDEGTLISLVHSDFDKLINNVDYLFNDISKGWNMCFKDLDEYLSNMK